MLPMRYKVPNYSFRCDVGHTTDEIIIGCKYEDRDNQICPDCGMSLIRQITAPNFPRASYVDGQRGKTGAWKDMREASALNKEAATDTSQDNKKAIAKEIRDRLRVDIQR